MREGALALSGDAGIGDIRENGHGRAAGAQAEPGSVEEVDVYGEFADFALSLIDAEAIGSVKVVLDGGNDMGPMVGQPPAARGSSWFRPIGSPTAIPHHEPNPLIQEKRMPTSRRLSFEAVDLGIAWDGDAERRLFIEWPRLCAREVLLSSTDVRASRAVADTVEEAGGTRAHATASGTPSSRRRMREEGGVFGGEVSGHYYFADFYNADSGTLPARLILELLGKAGRPGGAARALPLAVLHLGRDQLRGRTTRTRRSRRSGSATRTRASASSTASRSTTRTGTSTAPSNTERRCGCAWRASFVARGHGAQRDQVLSLIRG